MMKKILILFFTIALAITVDAQFTNTTWEGQFNVPSPTDMILQFKTDTLQLNYPDRTPLETMSYRISNDTLTLRKIDGQSDCDYSLDATYKILIKDKRLYITSLNDYCSVRVAAWPVDGMTEITSTN